MLTAAQRERIEVILVSPRNPLNIGAVARAMANFGFLHLTVVAPYAPHWREARSAVGAPQLLQHARETECLSEAVADCNFVAGTGTLTHRKPEQPVVSLPDVAPILTRQLANRGRIALMFGPEKHGLTRDDLAYCHALVEIPTDHRQPSMNLGQAVAVCLYEVACRMLSGGDGDTNEVGGLPSFGQEKGERMGLGASANELTTSITTSRTPAASAMLERLAGVIEETMSAAGYSPRAMQPANRHDLRVLLRRLAPSGFDTRRMLGLFRRILWRLDRAPSARERSR